MLFAFGLLGMWNGDKSNWMVKSGPQESNVRITWFFFTIKLVSNAESSVSKVRKIKFYMNYCYRNQHRRTRINDSHSASNFKTFVFVIVLTLVSNSSGATFMIFF